MAVCLNCVEFLTKVELAYVTWKSFIGDRVTKMSERREIERRK